MRKICRHSKRCPRILVKIEKSALLTAGQKPAVFSPGSALGLTRLILVIGMFSEIMELLPLVAPLLVIQLGLQVFCLLDLWKFNKERREKQDRLVWTIVVVLFGLLGTIAYIVFERR